MKPYKTEAKNNEVRKAVRAAREYLNIHINCSRKYLSNDEFTSDMCRICNVSYSIAQRVTWFVRADGARDLKALELWGFNQHTA